MVFKAIFVNETYLFMKVFNINSAEYIKCKVIDFILSTNSNVMIGNEIMYGTERRLVDLVLLNDNRVTAIEIKSDNDSLKRIKEQIIEYKKNFNYVVLVITEKHLAKTVELTSKDIGIYLIKNDSSISIIRLPKLQKGNDKREILYSINSRYLRSIKNSDQKTDSADELRSNLEKRGITILQNIFYKYLISKISPRFKLFLSEKGESTHIEDLSILSSSKISIE